MNPNKPDLYMTIDHVNITEITQKSFKDNMTKGIPQRYLEITKYLKISFIHTKVSQYCKVCFCQGE